MRDYASQTLNWSCNYSCHEFFHQEHVSEKPRVLGGRYVFTLQHGLCQKPSTTCWKKCNSMEEHTFPAIQNLIQLSISKGNIRWFATTMPDAMMGEHVLLPQNCCLHRSICFLLIPPTGRRTRTQNMTWAFQSYDNTITYYFQQMSQWYLLLCYLKSMRKADFYSLVGAKQKC